MKMNFAMYMVLHVRVYTYMTEDMATFDVTVGKYVKILNIMAICSTGISFLLEVV